MIIIIPISYFSSCFKAKICMSEFFKKYKKKSRMITY